MAIVLFIGGCSKDEILKTEEHSDMSQTENAAQDDMLKGYAMSFYRNNLPVIKFVPTNKDQNIYTVVLRDPPQSTTVRVDIRVRYQDQSTKSSMAGTNEVVITLNKFREVGKATQITFPKNFDEQILSVYIEYREGDKVVKVYDYKMFVFSDGTTALQKPTLKVDSKGIVGRWTFDDAAGQESSNMVGYSVVVENDPAEQVEAVELAFDEKNSVPAPKSYTNYLKRKAKYGQHMIFSGVIAFSGKPAGKSFDLSVSMLDKSGIIISEPVAFTSKPIRGKEGARVLALRMREVKSSDGKVTQELEGIVLDMKPEKFGYVLVTFTEPFGGVKPTQTSVILRKRPELLFDAWDNEIEDYLNEIQSNPIHMGSDNTHVNPLFEQSVAGHVFHVTVAVFDKNGKQMSESQTFDVTVEGEVSDEPVVLSTKFYSADGGKTWFYEAVIQDNGQWVEKVQLEFVKPFEGPAPVYNPIGLNLVGKKDGNIKIYSGRVEYAVGANPAGFFYNAIIQQFGYGTRSTASQANNKAELL